MDYDIRLHGANSVVGLVEVCIGTTWRRWCGSSFSNDAASVACRQLGYPGHSKTQERNAKNQNQYTNYVTQLCSYIHIFHQEVTIELYRKETLT